MSKEWKGNKKSVSTMLGMSTTWHPELWNELLVLEQEQNKVSPCFCYNLTLTEINNKIDWINRRLKLF